MWLLSNAIACAMSETEAEEIPLEQEFFWVDSASRSLVCLLWFAG